MRLKNSLKTNAAQLLGNKDRIRIICFAKKIYVKGGAVKAGDHETSTLFDTQTEACGYCNWNQI